MIRNCLLDTGPLVAGLNNRDQNHQLALKYFKEISSPLFTCEAVVTETCFLISAHPVALSFLHKWLKSGQLQIGFSLKDKKAEVFNLMRKYHSLPMAFADACLVVMFESTPNSQVFTLDHHFHVYRTSTRRTIKTVGLD